MASATFETTVTATGNNTGIVVPDDVIERLGAGRRPSVIVDVNGRRVEKAVALFNAGKPR